MTHINRTSYTVTFLIKFGFKKLTNIHQIINFKLEIFNAFLKINRQIYKQKKVFNSRDRFCRKFARNACIQNWQKKSCQ